MKTYIHLKPSLQEFVVCAFLGGGRTVTAADTFGKLIKPWLQLPPKNYDAKIPTAKNIFEFELPNYNDKNTLYNFYISPKGERYIAVMLNEIFLQQMFLHLDRFVKNNSLIKDTILDYCYSYNISFKNINYESLKKSYYRYRKNKKKSSRFVPQLSPRKKRSKYTKNN
ncbi:MAG: hypothetical protein LBP63_11070 [Prevotellaceae bacterium]|jgi:hypothetical protein|nr:hypothetical protein [Prevotellaceae bacterium]